MFSSIKALCKLFQHGVLTEAKLAYYLQEIEMRAR